MYILASFTGNKNGGFGATGHSQHLNSSHMYGNATSGNGNNHQRNMQQNQKTRKPYFMPYMSLDAVNRGLANGDLFRVCFLFLLFMSFLFSIMNAKKKVRKFYFIRYFLGCFAC